MSKINTDEIKFANNLINFIEESPTQFHCIQTAENKLNEHGFTQLDPSQKWDIKSGGKYYVTRNLSSLVAFEVGDLDIKDGFKIIASHTDSPAIRIKPAPEMIVENSYLKLNTEIYGGPILNTWFDRPLGIAGRVVVRGKSPFYPKEILLNIKEPIAIIPNLAIHINREVNKGVEINSQKDTLPLIATVEDKFEKDNFLLKLIAERVNSTIDNILDFEMYLYEIEKGCVAGINNEFISASKLDNLAMVHASLSAFMDSEIKSGINVISLFDNEEVGSTTKQGAASPFLPDILERIALSAGLNREEFIIAKENSFMISADLSHALHPNNADKNDPTSKNIVNSGPAIKVNAAQRYVSDGYSVGVYKAVCKEENVPVQIYTDPSDRRGGSTLGPISSTQLDIRSVDVGNPTLAMHSIRELGGVKDHHYIYRSFKKYFSL